VLGPTAISRQLQAAVDATGELRSASGDPSHGFFGFDWALKDAFGSFTASKGGWLPGQGTVLQVTTGGFTYALAINGNADVKFDWMTPISAAAQGHAWADDDLFPMYGMPSLAPAARHAATLDVAAPRPAHTLASVRASMARGRTGTRG
jgi:hypothetical protein